MKFLLILFLLVSGCREFYDEEFEEFERNRANQRNEDGTVAEDNSYRAELTTTDQNVPDLWGSVNIDVRNRDVTIDLDLEGVPENLIQLHYSYINTDCSALQVGIPNLSSGTRSFTLNETVSVDGLASDLRATGTAQSEGDINLAGKSFVVKAFANSSIETNQFIILCGRLTDNDTDNTTTTGTDGTTTGGFGTTTGGTFGTTTGGDFGTTTGGSFGTTTGESFDTTTGGDFGTTTGESFGTTTF